MAGDWIPWQKGLTKRREVLAVARKARRSSRECAAILMEFWEWADSETSTGELPSITLEQLPEIITGTNKSFWQAVVDEGWLTQSKQGLAIPRFERWLGNSAKKRLENNLRQRLSREKRDKSATTEQNRTEEETHSLGEGRGDARGETDSPTREWPKGSFAVAVGQSLSQDQLTTAPWFSASCEAVARAFGYRRLSDPITLADWFPALAIFTSEEVRLALQWLKIAKERHPKGRAECLSKIVERVEARRRAAAAEAPPAPGPDPDDQRRALDAQRGAGWLAGPRA